MEVTVLVFAYNSEKTIIETLNSIYHQTYSKIHLIISDDASKDQTVNVAKKWIDTHKKRFISIKIIENEDNLGTSKHFDMRLREIATEWVKPIAADDILLKNCIEDNVKYIQANDCSKVGVVFSKMIMFSTGEAGYNYRVDYEEILYQKSFSNLSVEEQAKRIIRREILCSPSMFINVNAFKKIGGGDVKIKNIEDWPLKIKFARNGFSLRMMDVFTIFYRQGQSISRSNDMYFKEDFLVQLKSLKEIYCYPYIEKQDYIYWWNEKMTEWRYWIIINVFSNRRSFFTSLLNGCLGMLTTLKWKKPIINYLESKKNCKVIKDIVECNKLKEDTV